jgi:thiamine biosynthesis lipoprotein
MGTVVEIRIVGKKTGHLGRRAAENALAAATGWFERVEHDCSRFDPASELRRLSAVVDRAVEVSPLLFSAIHFAIAVAIETDGAFDPTIGSTLESLGFDTHPRTGERHRSAGGRASYRDVLLDEDRRAITLLRPLTLDLGAVAKGLAVDLAARELAPLENFAIDAGGDLYLAGHNADGEPWSVGIRHPRGGDDPLATVRVSNLAVCTSGDYERRVASPDTHHILDPRHGVSTTGVASVTTVGESAMVADALGTAAFVLGPPAGLDLLERHGLEGMIVDDQLHRRASDGWASLLS